MHSGCFCAQSTPGPSDGEESDGEAGDAGETECSGGKDAPAAPVAEAEALDLSDAPEPSASGVSMDEALESAVLLGLQTLKNAELPIQFSEFFSKHMQPQKPEGAVFEEERGVGLHLDTLSRTSVHVFGSPLLHAVRHHPPTHNPSPTRRNDV